MLANLITWFQKPVVERAIKTFVEATAAQAALYTTVVPTTPGVKGTAAVSVGATVISILWNTAIAWATKAKSAKLDQLAQAIDTIVDQRLREQEQLKASAQVPHA